MIGVRELVRGPRVSVSWQIMAVPERKPWALELADMFDCDVTWDEKREVWDTGRRALLAGTGDWVVVVQDDALINPQWFNPQIVEEALRWVDTPRPVAFYTGEAGRRAQPSIIAGHDLAQTNNVGWVEYFGPIWGPAVAIPTEHVEELVWYADRNTAKGYDTKIMNYWKSRKVDCWYTSPSLVEHRPVHENPSAISATNRTANRQAYEHGPPRGWGRVQECSPEILHPWVWMTDGRRRSKVRRGTLKWTRLRDRNWDEELAL